MPLPENFAEAADRLFVGAVHLQPSNWPLADHCFGLGAECSLKAVLISIGGFRGSLPRSFKVHLPDIWDEFQAFRPAQGSPCYNLPMANPFLNWAIEDRYAGDSAIDPARCQRHRVGALEAMKILERARLDGLL